MGYDVKLNDEQKSVIKEILENNIGIASICNKCRVVLYRSEGMSYSVISYNTGLSVPYIKEVLDKYTRHGNSYLTSTRQNNIKNMKKVCNINLSDEVREKLQKIYDDPLTTKDIRKRIFVILSKNKGVSENEISIRLDCTAGYVAGVLYKFNEQGIRYITGGK